MQSTEPSLSSEPSSQLLEAQKRLLKLREELGFDPGARIEPQLQAALEPYNHSWELRNAQKALQQKRLQLGIATNRCV